MKKTLAKRAWINVMELLVAEEIERQLGQLAARKASFFKPEEVMTYALNRLAPLYASSARGLEMQENRARQEFAEPVRVAVRQGIAAVERDPLRHSTPIEIPEDENAQRALRVLQSILQNPSLDWDNLPTAVETALKDASQGKVSWRPRALGRPGGNFDLSTGRIRSRS